ncbi:MAG: hypothetical protein ABIF77_10005 [bacterium]
MTIRPSLVSRRLFKIGASRRPLSLVPLLWLLLGLCPGSAGFSASQPADFAATAADTNRTTPPAEEVILDFTALDDTLLFVDVDSSLWAGHGVLLAFEDTIPFADGRLDTLFASAPRVKVSEVVRRIGERMEADRLRMKEHAFTGVVKIVAYDNDKEGAERKWTAFEAVERNRLSGDGTYQTATIWTRESKFEGDELDEEEIEDEVETDWGELSSSVTRTTPFSLHTGDEFNYSILDRRLVGANVVYKVHFEPKSQFKALPSGTVWVDFGDFVIRRAELEMTGAVPMPLVIKGIPVYKFRRVQKGDYWVLGDIYARVELHQIPLLGIPRAIEVYYQTSRHVIDGTEYPDNPAQVSGEGE